MYQYPDYLMHYGIPGMKWGVRKQRVISGKTNHRSSKGSMSEADRKARRRRRNAKIAAGVAGGVAAAALATYGTYKFSKFVGLTNYKYHMELGEKKVMDHIRAANDLFAKNRGKYGTSSESFRKAQRATERGIFNDEIANASRDTFGQAVKNTATYYKSHKRKRR